MQRDATRITYQISHFYSFRLPFSRAPPILSEMFNSHPENLNLLPCVMLPPGCYDATEPVALALACTSLLVCQLHWHWHVSGTYLVINLSLPVSRISFLCSAQIVQNAEPRCTLTTPSPKKRVLVLTIKYGIIGPGVSAGEWLQLLQVVGTGDWKMMRLLDVDWKGPYYFKFKRKGLPHRNNHDRAKVPEDGT